MVGCDASQTPLRSSKKFVVTRRILRFTKLLSRADRELFIPPEARATENFLSVCRKGNPWGTRRAHAHWPVHAPLIPVIPPVTVQELKDSQYLSSTDKGCFEYVDNADVYARCHTFESDQQRSLLSMNDQLVLTDHGIFETAPKGIGSGYVFDVEEYVKQRRRLVHDTLTPNVMCDEPPNPRFRLTRDLQSLLHKGSYAATIDLKACFYQWNLHSDVRKYFSIFTDQGEYLQACRLPMEFKWSVVIAQNLLKHFAAKAGIPPDEVDLYIDNILLVGSKDVVIRRKARLLELFKEAGVTVGDLTHGPIVDHRGMVMDFENKCVSIRPSFVEKLVERVKVNKGTWAQHRSIIGSVVYALQILRVPLGCMYHVFKNWARHAATKPTTHVDLWKESVKQLDAAMTIIERNEPVSVFRQLPAEAFIVTDACTTNNMLAGVYVYDGYVRWFAHRHEADRDIAVLEALAVDYAVHRWLRPGRTVHLLCDNVVVLVALAKGLSMNFGVNSVVRDLLGWMHTCGAHMELWYIASQRNCADPFTREMVFSDGQEHVLHDLATISSALLPRAPRRVDLSAAQLFEGSSLPIKKWER